MSRYISPADRQRARSHLRDDGREKRRYGPHAAKDRAAEMGKEAYLCTVCGWWHIGTKTESTQ